jgi:ankyrin repeat protein
MARLEHIQSVAAIERKRLESLSVAARVSEKLGTGFNELPRADEFFQAVRHGDLHSAFHFLKADEMYVAAVDSHSGNSALHIAVTENNSAMTRLLIQSGAPIALKNARGVSPVDLLKKYPEQMGIFREVGVI